MLLLVIYVILHCALLCELNDDDDDDVIPHVVVTELDFIC